MPRSRAASSLVITHGEGATDAVADRVGELLPLGDVPPGEKRSGLVAA